jgi:hypothetical protein
MIPDRDRGPEDRRGRKLRPGEFGDTVMVVHGPEAFDEGDVALLQDLLAPGKTVVAGVMARTAAEESGLPVTLDGGVPSSVVGRIPGPIGRPGSEGAGAVPGGWGPSGETRDRPGGKGAPLDRTGGRVFLVNRGKTPESGRIFGEIVASRLPPGRPLVQLECSSGTVYLWNGDDRAREFARLLAGATVFSLVETSVETAGPGGGKERAIRGCVPGEAVLVGGIVIGTATAGTVLIREEAGRVVPVSGLSPKPHGLEKLGRLGPVDLPRAWCKSGQVRKTSPRQGGCAPATGRVLVIDHCGHDLYRAITPDTCGILAIGDDTTAVCGHISAHRGIPVFGVVDGDRDGLVPEGFPPGSVVVEVGGGTDDEAGQELASLAGDTPVSWGAWVARALALLGDRCRVIRRYPPAGPGSPEDHG